MMKTSKKQHQNQLRLIEKKLVPWLKIKDTIRPRAGWLKAIRGSLGVSARQLGKRLGKTHQVILRLEARELRGKVTLDSLDSAARAMNCHVVYAIIPDSKFGSLESILDERAERLATLIAREATHSMKLEDQEVDLKSTKEQINRLRHELKMKLDSRLWEK